MADCAYFEELCSAALDGELDRAHKRELDAHLAACPACAAYLEDLRLMRTAWGDLKEPLPDELHEKIMSGVEAEARAKAAPAEQKRRRRPPVFTMIAAAAACVMLVVSGAVGDMLGAAKTGGSAPKDAASGAAMESVTDFAGARNVDGDTGESEEFQPARIMPGAAMHEQDPAENGASGAANAGGALEAEAGYADKGMQTAGKEPRGAASALAVTLPDELQAYTFGFCYVAVGAGDPPAIEQASLIEKHGNAYYFRIDNSMSGLDKITAQLQEAGFETALRSDIGVKTDENAPYSLLIVAVEA